MIDLISENPELTGTLLFVAMWCVLWGLGRMREEAKKSRDFQMKCRLEFLKEKKLKQKEMEIDNK